MTYLATHAIARDAVSKEFTNGKMLLAKKLFQEVNPPKNLKGGQHGQSPQT